MSKTNNNAEYFVESHSVIDEIKSFNKYDIKIKILADDKTPHNTSHKISHNVPQKFEAEIYGDSIDWTIINGLRRTVDRSIPIYGFHRSNIMIDNEHTRTRYNNDIIYGQIESLVIPDIPNDVELHDPRLYLQPHVLKVLYPQYPIHENKDTQNNVDKIELLFNFKNETNTYKYLTTHDAMLKINGKVVNNYKKHPPVSVLVLNPGDYISLRAEANLGLSMLPKIGAIYEATTNPIHIQKSDTDFIIKYKSLGQLDKNEIFVKACRILRKKLDILKKYIETKYDKEPEGIEKMIIELYGEDHTLGNMLSTTLKKIPEVKAASYDLIHPFQNNIILSYSLNDANAGYIKILIQVITYLSGLFKTMETVFTKAIS